MTIHATHLSSNGDDAEVTIRCLGVDDADAVRHLAQRDSARAPTGVLLGAELDGRLMAAISVTTREVVADPFHRTAELVEALRSRVSQIDGRPRRGSRGWLSRMRRTVGAKLAVPARC